MFLQSQGIICTPEEYSRQASDTSLRCLTRGQSIGLTVRHAPFSPSRRNLSHCLTQFAAESGFVSLFAILFVIASDISRCLFLQRNALQYVRKRGVEDWNFLQEAMALFFADLIQALGAVLDIKWINEERWKRALLYCSRRHTTIGRHGRHYHHSRKLGHHASWRKGMDAIITFKLVILTYWCWIGQDHTALRIIGEYVWFWLTLGMSSLVYIPLSLWSRGNIAFDDKSWWKFTFHSRSDEPESEEDKFRRRNSLNLIADPVATQPLSVGLSRTMNVFLLLVTRPDSVLFGRIGRAGRGRSPSPRGWTGPANQGAESSQSGRDDESIHEMGRLLSIDTESISSRYA
ncbi:uncharacterized protein BT62DRAFT_1005888 [Guyanagaster necrorhizus]|uniref:Uncharacterized protein n=1 Tax=Guyanagaster necrorhizus TaxID=856835 RepID=A0A9P8ASR1_9AGAR|nr:uncharacterized protein BT62DRAFT_1005888 [Guyanagaster necrorhizus MCA 3950]KAG7446599.1 hypothetical protein BT62DRAFT_1005888 [Guyanagaster necrorhizus MCA 3950]